MAVHVKTRFSRSVPGSQVKLYDFEISVGSFSYFGCADSGPPFQLHPRRDSKRASINYVDKQGGKVIGGITVTFFDKLWYG